jgi:hypothetical protein
MLLREPLRPHPAKPDAAAKITGAKWSWLGAAEPDFAPSASMVRPVGGA